MNANPSPRQPPEASPPSGRPPEPVQTGALPGGQPGQGVNASSSAPGQSNVDAIERLGTEYGKDNRKNR